MDVSMLLALLCGFFVFAHAEEKSVSVDDTTHPHKQELENCEAEEGISAKECGNVWREKSIDELPEKCSCLISCMVEKLQLMKEGDRANGEFDTQKIEEFIAALSEDTENNRIHKEYLMIKYQKCKESTEGYKGCAAGKEMLKCFKKED